LTLVFVPALPAQSADRERDYKHALDLYRRSQYRESIESLIEIGPVPLQEAEKAETNFDFRAKDTHRLESAAVMPLDAAASAYQRRQIFSSVVFQSMSVRVINRLRELGARSPAMRQWYLADAALLEGARDFQQLRSLTADARALFPRDARILLSSGSALETEGKHLDDAAAFYRASLAVDASNAQSHVRLARVLLRLGDAAGSLAELDRMPAPSEERMAYFRELFRGAALAALGRPVEAERKFVSALEWNAQAPYLGIAESMASRGDDAGARKAIAKLLTANVDQEPWAAYLRGQWRYFPELLVEARQALK